MTGIRTKISIERFQYTIFVVLSLGIMGFTAILYSPNFRAFQTYFGNANPLLVISLVALLGTAFLTYLLLTGRFEIFRRENHNLRELVLYSSLAILLAIVMITVDIIFLFPEDINVPFPQSLLFYPTMGYVVEVIFHIIPLSLLDRSYIDIQKYRS